MKNKKLYLILLLIFSAICLYNLFYTGKRLSMDGELASMDQQQLSEWNTNAENLASYKTASENSFSLGLDLQGGMFVTLEIGVDEILKTLADFPKDEAFNKALVEARKKQATRQEPYINLFVESLRELEPNVKLAKYFGGMKIDDVNYKSTDDQIIAALNGEIEASIDITFERIRQRIDQFGVASPTIQKQAGTNRILVELPGVKDVERVRKLLRSTARLEFWPVYSLLEAYPYVQKANDKIAEMNGYVATQADTTAKATTDSTGKAVASNDTAANDTAAQKQLSEEETKKKFPLLSILLPPQFDQMSREQAEASPVVGYSQKTDTAKVNAMLAQPAVRALLPPDLKFYWTSKPENKESTYLSLIAIKNRDNIPPLDGRVVVDTRVEQDQNNQWVVSMYMDGEGSGKWKKMTTDYLGKPIAIVLDNQVYSYPMVRNVITGGNSQISGNFTAEEAKDLANILKAGKLPAPIRIEGEEVVGATLGSEAINKGLVSFVLSFLVVIIFMMVYYRKSGFVADIALLVNLFFIVAVCAAWNVVMTLPGIAGIVLTLAMAVDANVLIYERVREELENGRGIKGAVQEGFRNAFSAIMDGNLTTLLTGLILYSFGTGPIRGFAVTLIIGIITSLVAALFVTRIILEYMLEKNEKADISFGTQAAARFFKRMNFQFIIKRKNSYVVTGIIAALSLGAILGLGFKYGVDFSGGRQYVVEFKQNLDVEKVRTVLTDAMDNNSPVIKTIGNKNQIMITTSYLYESTDEKADDKVKNLLVQTINKELPGADVTIVRSTKVGPTIAKDIQEGAIKAIIFSLIMMFAYIFFRFSGWQFGVGAVASLVFNVLVVLGIFSALSYLDIFNFSMELDQNFIAAILTIVGYTINDTVVVFDRIRENVREDKANTPLDRIYNSAINDTLSRTVVTAMTTLASSLILFLFGGDVLKGFMLALFIGIVVGTFSSIFIASPIALDLTKRFGSKPKTTDATLATGKASTGAA